MKITITETTIEVEGEKGSPIRWHNLSAFAGLPEAEMVKRVSGFLEGLEKELLEGRLSKLENRSLCL